MPFYELTRVMQYTETLMVEAESQEDAEDYFSNGKDFEENHDYYTYDQQVREITQEEFLDRLSMSTCIFKNGLGEVV